MYNRYIPQELPFAPVEQEPAREGRPRPQPPPPRGGPPPRKGEGQAAGTGTPFAGVLKNLPFLGGGEGLGALFSAREGKGLSGLLKSLRLDGIDTGDILLLLILLFLLAEEDDLEMVIALGLVLFMGLGDGDKRDKEDNE